MLYISMLCKCHVSVLVVCKCTVHVLFARMYVQRNRLMQYGFVQAGTCAHAYECMSQHEGTLMFSV